MEQTKFLGVVVQNNIRWNSHIEYIFKKKNAKGIGIIYKAKDKLMERAKISLYYALIYPGIHYCNAVWGNDYKTGLSVVHRQQKRLLWIIFGLRPRDTTSSYFDETEMVTIFRVNQFETVLFCYKWNQNLLPRLFGDFFAYRSAIHSRETRQSRSINLPRCRTEARRSSLAYREAFLSNHAMHHFQSLVASIKVFKRKLRQAVLEKLL